MRTVLLVNASRYWDVMRGVERVSDILSAWIKDEVGGACEEVDLGLRVKLGVGCWEEGFDDWGGKKSCLEDANFGDTVLEITCTC